MIGLLARSVFAQQPIQSGPKLTTSKTRRAISAEEAHDLLRAFLNLPGGDILQQNDFHYPDGSRYPAFYFFEAILGVSSPGPVGVLQERYYAVDRQTGDVWNSVICEPITSSSWAELQVALRRRIGLMGVEYRKIKKLGPLCEPGYPRVGFGK